MHSPRHDRADDARSGERGRAALEQLGALAAAVALPLDPRSREERALKLAGYSNEQIQKLLARTESTNRRAA